MLKKVTCGTITLSELFMFVTCPFISFINNYTFNQFTIRISRHKRLYWFTFKSHDRVIGQFKIIWKCLKEKNCPTCFRLEASLSVGEDENSSDTVALIAGLSSSDSLSAGVSNMEMDSMQIGDHILTEPLALTIMY